MCPTCLYPTDRPSYTKVLRVGGSGEKGVWTSGVWLGSEEGEESLGGEVTILTDRHIKLGRTCYTGTV